MQITSQLFCILICMPLRKLTAFWHTVLTTPQHISHSSLPRLLPEVDNPVGVEIVGKHFAFPAESPDKRGSFSWRLSDYLHNNWSAIVITEQRCPRLAQVCCSCEASNPHNWGTPKADHLIGSCLGGRGHQTELHTWDQIAVSGESITETVQSWVRILIDV